MENDTPRRIGSDRNFEAFEIGLNVRGSAYDRHVEHVVADIAHNGNITLTRTDNGNTPGNEDGSGWKPYVETQRFTLSVNEMILLIDAWERVRDEEEHRQVEQQEVQRDPDEEPF